MCGEYYLRSADPIILLSGKNGEIGFVERQYWALKLYVRQIIGVLRYKDTTFREREKKENGRHRIRIFLSFAWAGMFLFHFKGTPSREEQKTVLSVFATIESALTGPVGLLRSSVSL